MCKGTIIYVGHFELPDKIANIEFHSKNLKDVELIDDVIELVTKDSFNYFLVSLKNERGKNG